MATSDLSSSELRLSQIMDHAVLDRRECRAGRVDDLVLEFQLHGEPDLASPGGRGAGAGGAARLILRELVSGPVARPTGKFRERLFLFFYGLIGVKNPKAAHIDWNDVAAIDVMVHLKVDRRQAGLHVVDESCGRLIGKIPGAGKKR